MNQKLEREYTDKRGEERSQAAMEQALIDAYLKGKGYTYQDLQSFPKDQAKSLMKEACEYASLRLAQVESSALFRDKIHRPS